ncbi:hypothetical protein BC831DRAFT_468177 [Entophlyctis helioformis]|nr:hypothetical protein BC831DRAFT_468177 [Entophlyctis helioformis]
MLIFVPPWVAHATGKRSKSPIYALDVHPSGDRLATAGLVNIKIWNMAPIRDQQSEQDANVPKLLSTLTMHDGAILCVKWSPDGQYLASGSEDAKVIIWRLDSSKYRNTGFGETTTGSGGSTRGGSVESYRSVKILPGHESDVADVSWSPDGRFIASCGFDRSISVWETTTGAWGLVRRIAVHAGFVKGLAWDPVGKYLASQSDDRSVKVFRVSDWHVETTITAPLSAGASSSFFSRGWHGAPTAAGAVCVAPLIQRQDWKSEDFLVGHKAAIEVAVSGQTASPSGWHPNPRAVASISQLVEHSVLGRADGYGLLGCSYDGTVVYIQFTAEELGRALSVDEMNQAMSRYGKMPRAWRGDGRHIIPPRRLCSWIWRHRQRRRVPRRRRPGRVAELMAGGQTGVWWHRPPAGGSRAPVPAPVTAPAPVFAAPPLPANGSVAARGGRDCDGGNSSSGRLPLPSAWTVTKDGKKRIQPVFLQSPDAPVATSTPSVSRTSGLGMAAAMSTPSMAFGGATPIHQSGMVTPAAYHDGSQTQMLPFGGIASAPLGWRSGGAAAPASTAVAASLPAKYVLPIVNTFDLMPQLSIPEPRLVVVAERADPVTGSRVVVECRNEPQSCKVVYTTDGDEGWRVGLSAPALFACLGSGFLAVSCADASLHLLFPAMVLPSACSFMACRDAFLLCIDGVGQLFVWNVLEQRQILSHVSVAPILTDNTLDDGDDQDMDDASEEAGQPSAKGKDKGSGGGGDGGKDGRDDEDDEEEEEAPGLSITAVVFKDDGIPVLTTSKGRSFTYHVGMCVWMQLADLTVPGLAAGAGGLAGHGHGDAGQQSRLQSRFLSLDEMEERLVSAEASGAAAEYRHWLKQYARKLADENATDKARDLLDELTGGGRDGGSGGSGGNGGAKAAADTSFSVNMSMVSATSGRSAWASDILGLPKRELLKEVIPILAQNRLFQRTLVHAAAAAAASDAGASVDASAVSFGNTSQIAPMQTE